MREESTGAEVSVWLRRHWLHIAISPLTFLLYTVAHECAHVVVAWLQGATITDVSVLPSEGSLGHMNYVFSEGSDGSTELVSIAPYLLWSGCMSVVFLLSLRRSGYSFPLASSLFLWGFLGAWGDIAMAGMSWSEAGRGDWAHVLGSSSGALDSALMAFAWLVVIVVGYGVQARLYKRGALSKASYAFLVLAGSFLWGLGTVVLALAQSV